MYLNSLIPETREEGYKRRKRNSISESEEASKEEVKKMNAMKTKVGRPKNKETKLKGKSTCPL